MRDLDAESGSQLAQAAPVFTRTPPICASILDGRDNTLSHQAVIGGAHPVEPKRIDAPFSVIVPTGSKARLWPDWSSGQVQLDGRGGESGQRAGLLVLLFNPVT